MGTNWIDGNDNWCDETSGDPNDYGDYNYGSGDEPSHEDTDYDDTCGDTGDFDDGSYY
jgi:hypothetical protein